jgi:hypothetical protein
MDPTLVLGQQVLFQMELVQTQMYHILIAGQVDVMHHALLLVPI